MSSEKIAGITYDFIEENKRCQEGKWIKKYSGTVKNCMEFILKDASCSHEVFSYSNFDENCYCVNRWVHCHLVSHNSVSTYEIHHSGTICISFCQNLILLFLH